MIKPPSTPKQELDATLEIIRKYGALDTVTIVGIRGYYRKLMGGGENSRGVYDDAIFIVAPECYLSFNANCDPGAHKKGIATLRKGLWSYKLGIHGLSKPKALQYTALVQAAKVTVDRDGEGEESGFFGINIHRGGVNTVSSLGCQTIHPSQWPSFIETIKVQLKKHDQKTVPYLLVEA